MGTEGISKAAFGLIRGRLALMHELTDIYKHSLTRNKDRLMELIKDKAERASKSELARKMRVAKGYYTLEMAPPRGAEIAQIKADIQLAKDFIKNGCYKHLTVKQAWLLMLVGTEIALWFYLGETIGKMHIVGYKV